MNNTDEILKKIPSEDWDWLANHLQKWHYVSDEHRLWLNGRTIGRFIDSIQAVLTEHGYNGGPLSVHAFEVPERGWLYLVYDTAHFDGPRDVERAYAEDEAARWHDHTIERVKDWLERLSDLRVEITNWVVGLERGDLCVEDRGTVQMHEELMRRYNVEPVKMPSFAIKKGDKELALFRPKGLWIIGANGRVDVVTPTEAPILVDVSENLTRPTR